MASMLSVVHAIHPHRFSSLESDHSEPGVVAAAFEARRSSKSGMSCTPMENNGRSLCGGAVDAIRSSTARGMFESMDRSYTMIRYYMSCRIRFDIRTKIAGLFHRGMGNDQYSLSQKRCTLNWKYQRSECLQQIQKAPCRMVC